MQQLELAMSPEVHERLAVAEAKIEQTQANVARILELVERMPGRLTKRMKRLLSECRDNQAKTYGQKRPDSTPPNDRDWVGAIRTLVIGAGIVGGLLGGIYQAIHPGDRPAPHVFQRPRIPLVRIARAAVGKQRPQQVVDPRRPVCRRAAVIGKARRSSART